MSLLRRSLLAALVLPALAQAAAMADFTGCTVVLEWTNHDCPYVRKHYGSGNMLALQKASTRPYGCSVKYGS